MAKESALIIRQTVLPDYINKINDPYYTRKQYSTTHPPKETQSTILERYGQQVELKNYIDNFKQNEFELQNFYNNIGKNNKKPPSIGSNINIYV